MTTMTMNAATFSQGSAFTTARFAGLRAALPNASFGSRALNVAAGAAMAAVPFAAIVWTFVSF